MNHRDDQESLGLLLVWAVGRALRQVGVATAVAVLSCAPFVAFAGVTLARNEYERLRLQTAHAAQMARHATLEVQALREHEEARRVQEVVERHHEAQERLRQAERQRLEEPQRPIEIHRGCAGLPAPAPERLRCAAGLGIETISRDRYAVPREAVDCMLESSMRLHPVRVLPVTGSSGRVIGVRIYGIADADALWALGLRNGDMLMTVNGMDITAPDHALEAYASARRSTTIRLGLVRDHEPRELRYYITGW